MLFELIIPPAARNDFVSHVHTRVAKKDVSSQISNGIMRCVLIAVNRSPRLQNDSGRLRAGSGTIPTLIPTRLTLAGARAEHRSILGRVFLS